MSELSKILYLIAGTIMPAAIGLLHLYVHFKDLLTPDIQRVFGKDILIMSKEQDGFMTWGLMSFMMGWSFVIIGLLNYHIYMNIGVGGYPPTIGIAAMGLYLLGVVYVGRRFKGPMQLYGGIVGLIMIGICAAIKMSAIY